MLSGKSAYRFESKFTSDLQHGYKHNDRNLVDSGSAACILETIFFMPIEVNDEFLCGSKVSLDFQVIRVCFKAVSVKQTEIRV